MYFTMPSSVAVARTITLVVTRAPSVGAVS
jgi:hypothetical protein